MTAIQQSKPMPRKIGPKYGIDPVQQVPAFSFTESEIERLLNALRLVRESYRDAVVARLVALARTYRWRRDQNQAKPNRAEQNAALAEINHLAQKLHMSLHAIDMDTEWQLMMSVPVFRTNNLTDEIRDFADRLGDIAQAAQAALKVGKQKSGPRALAHLQRTVLELANLYEEVTGKCFSHNPRVRTKYDGEPHSSAGHFIVEFFKIVDSEIPPTSISTALAKAVKARPQRPASN